MLRPAPAPGSRTSPISTSSPAEVTPPTQTGHTTYRLASQPGIGVLWTYADRNADGSFRRLGGGTYDAATDTYGQGAFNADDISRAAVVYLRDWQQTRSTSSRDRARELLRGLTYLQTASGPNAGNVVLWMQPDGTLNRSADPVEQPDPSDSDASFWLARTLWALGEGYAVVPRLRPGLRTFPPGPAAARGPRRRPPVAGRLRPAPPGRRPEHPRLADRRRRRRLRGGGARSGCLRPRRGRPRVASHAGAAQ